MRPTICSLFEPHHKQNLYTNPKRTAKSVSPNHRLRCVTRAICSKDFRFSKKFFAIVEEPCLSLNQHSTVRASRQAQASIFFPIELGACPMPPGNCFVTSPRPAPATRVHFAPAGRPTPPAPMSQPRKTHDWRGVCHSRRSECCPQSAMRFRLRRAG